MLDPNHQTSPSIRSSQLFRGIRFVLLGFDPVKQSQVSRKLVDGGGVDAGQYGPNCTHVIVDKLVYDDPLCVAARQDGKILVSSLWVDHSFDIGAPVDTTSVMYVPVRDLNGIPGAKSLVICLTGYQREDREDIMTMVELMGAQFSKPLIATKVTHLICYKFEGEKYLLAKKVKRIKLINHRWLEDCLKAWEILPEADYSKSGYELELEAEARDSEDEPEGVTASHNETKIASPHHSLLSKQEIPNTISNTSASNLYSNAHETMSVTMKTTSEQNNNVYASTSANKSPQNEAKTVTSASYSMKDPFSTTPVRTTVSAIDMKSNTSSAKRLNKLNLSDAINMSSSMVQKVTPYSGSAFCSVDEQTYTSSNKKMGVSCGSLKLQQMSQNNDVESAFQELEKDPPVEISPAKKPSNISVRKSSSSKGENVSCEIETNISKKSNDKDVGMAENVVQSPSAVSSDLQKSSTLNLEINEQSGGSKSTPVRRKSTSKKLSAPIETSPAQKSPSSISGRKPVSSKGKNISCDVAISKTSTSATEGLSTKSNNRDVGIVENVIQSSSAVSSDLQKSSKSSEINEQSGGSNPKPVRKKSISKKFTAPKLSKKNTVSQKGSIFLKNPEPVIDNENLFKYQQCEEVLLVGKLGKEIEKGVISGMQTDDETEPPEDNVEASKEKHEDGEPENTVDVLMEENTNGNVNVVDDRNNDENDIMSIKHKVSKGKKETALSMKEVTVKKSVKNNDLMIDNNFGKQETRGEATPSQAKKPVEVKRASDCNDTEHSKKGDDVDADMDIESVVNKKETKMNKRSLSKNKEDGLEKSAELKRAGVCNVEKVDDVDADMEKLNVVNKNEPKRNKRALSETKKDVSKRNVTDFEKSVDVETAEGVFNDPEHNNDEKDADVDAGMDIENVVKKNVTKRNKRLPSKTKKDASKINVNDLEKSVEVKSPEGVSEDADMDTENVLNKTETKRNKRPLSRTKKDDTKAVNKKRKPASNQAVETCDFEEVQKENVEIHVNDQSTGKKHVLKPAKEVHEKNIDKVDSDVVKDEPMWFILTGHTLQRKEFQQIIRRLKGRVCRVNHNWSYQATHFIVPDPIKRTEKFFAAAACGRWILKTDYLSASNQAGKFLPEEPYEWHKNGLSEDGQINLEAPRKWRLMKEKTGHGAFHGMKIVIYGECIAPSLDTLKRAVKAGDGTILATSPPYTRFLNARVDFAVVSPGMPPVDMWVQEFLKHEIPCVSADYLVEYVCKPGYSLERHVQYGTHVWAERSFNDLKKRLAEGVCEPRSSESADVACEVCGARDRGEEMLICGDEGGVTGCGVGTHIGCCDPPLEDVPEEDWFCSKCMKKPKNTKGKKGGKNKGSASRVK